MQDMSLGLFNKFYKSCNHRTVWAELNLPQAMLLPCLPVRLAQLGEEERQDLIPGVVALVHRSQWDEGRSVDRLGPTTSPCCVW